MTHGFRVELLGHPRFYVGGELIKLASLPKSLTLLGYLVVYRHAAIARDTLAFALWPDDSEVAATGKLRRHLHDLVHALPPPIDATPWLSVERDSVQWNSSSTASLDIDEFERWAADERTKALAANVYRGDLLEGIYDDWLFPERERLRGRYVQCLCDLVREHARQRDFGRAIEFGERLLAIDPWREDMLRELLMLRYDSGDRAGALHQYEAFAGRLLTDMGVQPMPETVALHSAILRYAPVTSASPSRRVEHNDPAPLLTLPLVGCRPQLDALKAAWNRAARGNGTTVFVVGEAGIGKSRLADEAASVARMQGGRVLMGFTVAPENRPYAPFMDALESASPYLNVAAIAALRSPAANGDGRDQLRLFESFVRALREVARQRPLLLVLEDVHGCGPATRALLEYVSRRMTQSPVFILATMREEELRSAAPMRSIRNQLVRDGTASQVALSRLHVTAVEELVEALAAQGIETPPASALYDTTDGHPLYLTELIRTPSTSQAQDGGFAGLIASRWANVDETAFTLAEIAAVSGDVFDIDLLSDATGWRYDRVTNGTRQLLDAALIQDAGREGTSVSYSFTHALVRAKIYEQIPQRRLVHRHAALALVLERRPEGVDIPAVIAHHFQQALLHDDAGRWFAKAAALARRVLAFDDALQYVKIGADISSDAQTQAVLLRIAEEIYGLRGERQLQRGAIQELEKLEAVLGEEAVRDTLWRRIRMYRACGEPEAETEALREFCARAGDADPVWQARASLESGLHALTRSRYEESSAALRQAEKLFSNLNDQAARVVALCALAEATIIQSDFGDAAACLEEAHRIAERTADGDLICATLRSTVAALMWRQEFSAAGALALRALQMSRNTGDVAGQANAHERLASVAVRLQKFGEADGHFTEALRLYRELESPHGIAVTLLNRGIFLSYISRFPEAEAAMTEALTNFRALEDTRGEFVAVLDLGMLSYYTGSLAEAKRCALDALRLARRLGNLSFEAMALTNLGAAERDLGELDAAIEHMSAGILNHERMARPHDLIADLTDLLTAYVRAGEDCAALQTAERIKVLMSTVPEEPRHLQYVLWGLALAYRDRDPESARAYLRRAHDAYLSLRAAHIDERSRDAFAAIRYNRDLLDAWAQETWPRRAADASAVG